MAKRPKSEDLQAIEPRTTGASTWRQMKTGRATSDERRIREKEEARKRAIDLVRSRITQEQNTEEQNRIGEKNPLLIQIFHAISKHPGFTAVGGIGEKSTAREIWRKYIKDSHKYRSSKWDPELDVNDLANIIVDHYSMFGNFRELFDRIDSNINTKEQNKPAGLAALDSEERTSSGRRAKRRRSEFADQSQRADSEANRRDTRLVVRVDQHDVDLFNEAARAAGKTNKEALREMIQLFRAHYGIDSPT